MPNQVLRRQSREVVFNVFNYMQKEKDKGTHNVNQVQRRTAEATGTSIRTVRNIIKESKNTDNMITVFRTPGKKRKGQKPVTGIDSIDKGVIRRCILNYYSTGKELPNLNKLLLKLKSEISFKGCVSSLNRVIKDLGFRWKKTVNKKKILIEKSAIRLKRIVYLQEMKKYRDEGRNIVYAHETCINSNPKESKADNANEELPVPASKGQRFIIAHAGSEEGFLPNSLLMFKSTSKLGDYHDDINFTDYERWLKTKLIPNLKPYSVVVIDNAAYHNTIKDPAPTSESSKVDMKTWLTSKGILFREDMLKPELYALICENKGAYKEYLVDAILSEHNHLVLRLPPFHSDLNPVEMAWASIKKFVASKKIEFNASQVMQLVEEKINMIQPYEWPILCSVVKNFENDYRASDLVLDDLSDNLVEYTGNQSESSESESEFETDDSDDSDDL